jgi:transposase
MPTSRSTAADDPSGVGPVTALATEVFLGDPARFADSKALASYVGMIPREYCSGERQRLGGLSKQGNPLLRFLWGEREPTRYAGTRSWGVFTAAN